MEYGFKINIRLTNERFSSKLLENVGNIMAKKWSQGRVMIQFNNLNIQWRHQHYITLGFLLAIFQQGENLFRKARYH